MLGPERCSNWDYEDHPDSSRIVRPRCRAILIELARGQLDAGSLILDTRSIHRRLFKDLTPAACPYLAGHYRGENFPSLRNYEVRVAADPRVGVPAANVAANMLLFEQTVKGVIAALDAGSKLPDAQVSKAQKLLYLVNSAAAVHVEFLRIHPYANGNGHMGRFIVWCLLGKYGHWPKAWPFDDRPGSPYTQLISDFRDGNSDPLVQFILKAIVG